VVRIPVPARLPASSITVSSPSSSTAKGKQYNESTAVLRFVGRHTGAYPVDNIETCWYADSLVDYSNEFITKFINMGQKIVDAHKLFAAWVDRIKVELKEHFATRPVAPM
jgi:hypothetical protein